MSSVRKLQKSKKFTNMFAVLDDSDDENSHSVATKASKKKNKNKSCVPSVVAVKIKEPPTKGVSYAKMAANDMKLETTIAFKKISVDPFPPKPRVLDLSNKRSWTDMMNDTDSDEDDDDYDDYENVWKI